jgi:SAM-dependent methyltransferase
MGEGITTRHPTRIARSSKRSVVRAEFLLQALVARSGRRAVTCPHCRSAECNQVATKARVVRIMRCATCGLYYTDPLYRSRLAANFYDRLYAAEGSTTDMPDSRTAARLRETGFKGSDKDASTILDRLRSLAGPKRRLLELGSSWGYFLYQARQTGLEPTGVEIAEGRRRFGIQHLSVHILPTLADVGNESFDIAFAAHVLEHFTDISTVYAELASLLRPGGHLLVEVPNFDLEQFGDRVLSLVGAVHPLGYDSGWFRRNLITHGFIDVAIYSGWDSTSPAPAARSTSSVIVVHARTPED